MLKGGAKKIVSLAICGVFAFWALVPSSVWASPITKASVIELTNQERIKAGLPIFWSNYKLNLAAQRKAEDMLKNGYWEHYHNGKSPWDWMREAGYEFKAAGENLAIDFFEVEPMIQAWMDSPTHRQNILNPVFREIGVGVAKGWFKDHETIIVVQMFGAPKNKKVQFTSQVAGVNGEYKEAEPAKENISKEPQAPKGIWAKFVAKLSDILSLIKVFLLRLVGAGGV